MKTRKRRESTFLECSCMETLIFCQSQNYEILWYLWYLCSWSLYSTQEARQKIIQKVRITDRPGLCAERSWHLFYGNWCLEKNWTKCWLVKLKFVVWFGLPVKSNPNVEGQACPSPSTVKDLTSAPEQFQTSSQAPGWTSSTVGTGYSHSYRPLHPFLSAHILLHILTSGSGPKEPPKGVRP